MLAALFLSLGLLVSTAYGAPTVTIGRTTVVGTEFDPARVEFFGGIPFAQPPVGQLRLAPPVLTTTINTPRFDASKFGSACLQTALPAGQVSEDCLNLNIFRPAGTRQTANLPVMVWIYGGGFVMGASSLYNGTEIVARSVARGTPVIFASINYRVGPLGFPQGIEAGQRGLTNLGLQDQLVALEWMQANIARFGGDRSKVTVIGESAGAVSINIHLLETNIRQLARAAILESTATSPTFGPERNEAQWQQFVAAVPACTSAVGSSDTFDCIRSSDSASLLRALTISGISGTNGSFGPVIDGPEGLLTDRPSQLTLQARLPTLIGSNLDEGTLFTPQGTNSPNQINDALTALTTPSEIANPIFLGETVQEIDELYPDTPALGSPFGTGNNTFGLNGEFKRFASVFGDFLFQSSRRTFTQDASDAGISVFAYLFTDPDAVVMPELLSVIFPNSPPAPGSLGVAHSTEINYVFNTLINKTPTAQALSITMQDYWLSFVTSLTPNDGRGSRRPFWQQYTSNNQILMELNGHNTALMSDDFRPDQILFFQNSEDALHR
ncbi:extracellular triacylglycerol lipase precursor [Pholiota conissans]|uniref:Carboxylic ester hydrolase n=1 Tax=Pholiota conissans TaxID=109636 RepID=A0A9P5YMU9_9AGAR|nr:extracellular triacylglycerol lipase precursor [Pholiota conissans]